MDSSTVGWQVFLVGSLHPPEWKPSLFTAQPAASRCGFPPAPPASAAPAHRAARTSSAPNPPLAFPPECPSPPPPPFPAPHFPARRQSPPRSETRALKALFRPPNPPRPSPTTLRHSLSAHRPPRRRSFKTKRHHLHRQPKASATRSFLPPSARDRLHPQQMAIPAAGFGTSGRRCSSSPASSAP